VSEVGEPLWFFYFRCVSFLSSYLSLWFQCVSSRDRLSDLLPVHVSVLKRSVLGLLFIDDLCRAVLMSNYHLMISRYMREAALVTFPVTFID
jgi:hypothetical protein